MDFLCNEMLELWKQLYNNNKKAILQTFDIPEGTHGLNMCVLNNSSTENLSHTMDIDNGPHFYPYKYIKVMKLCLLKAPTIYFGINFIFFYYFFACEWWIRERNVPVWDMWEWGVLPLIPKQADINAHENPSLWRNHPPVSCPLWLPVESEELNVKWLFRTGQQSNVFIHVFKLIYNNVYVMLGYCTFVSTCVHVWILLTQTWTC